MLAPGAQLLVQGLGALLDQGAQDMSGGADGTGAQGQRPDDVERVAHATGGQYRQVDRLRAAQRLQQAQRRRLAPADQVGQVALRSALVLNGDEVRASGPSHVDGRDAGARQGLDRSA